VVFSTRTGGTASPASVRLEKVGFDFPEAQKRTVVKPAEHTGVPTLAMKVSGVRAQRAAKAESELALSGERL
jgi:hypothetical protein